MSNARDDLARIIMSPESFDGGPVSSGPNPVYAARTADAILANHIVIPKADLPKVKDLGNHAEVGGYVMAGGDYKTAAARTQMLAMVAWNEYILNRDAKEAAKAAARDKRRDELADEFTAVRTYSGQLPYTQRLIDRIIELEQGAPE